MKKRITKKIESDERVREWKGSEGWEGRGSAGSCKKIERRIFEEDWRLLGREGQCGREGGKRSVRARRRKNLRRRLEEMEGRKVWEGRECESIQEELDERFFKKNGRWEGSTVWEGWRGRGVGARR
jgi:hypothetical protein